jgi:hypothetical protein
VYIYKTKISSTPKINIMNSNTIGFWNSRKEKLKQEFPVISDEDLQFCEGKEKEMIELLGYKLGKTSEEMHSIIEALN